MFVTMRETVLRGQDRGRPTIVPDNAVCKLLLVIALAVFGGGPRGQAQTSNPSTTTAGAYVTVLTPLPGAAGNKANMLFDGYQW